MRKTDQDAKQAIIDLFEGGYTEQRIAWELGISQATVSRVCKGRKRPRERYPTNASNYYSKPSKEYSQERHNIGEEFRQENYWAKVANMKT